MTRVFAAAIIVLLAALAAQTTRLYRAQLTISGMERDAARAAQDAQRAAREAERAIADAYATAATEYEKGKHDAETAADAVVTGLRVGTVRLRNQWRGCEAARLSDAASAARELDAAEQSRRESAARIVRAADECDAQVRGLQAIVMADRERAR